MEISQILPANNATPASRGSQDTATDGDFSRMLKQSGEAASGKEPNDASAVSDGSDSLAKTDAKGAAADQGVTESESGLESAAQQSEATVSGAAIAGTPAAGTPAALSPLTQNIAQAMSARITSQPTQPPVIANTPDIALVAGQAALSGNETLDLAAIRERLTTIANAQRGATAVSTPAIASAGGTLAGIMPSAGQAALDVAKGSLPHISDRITGLEGQLAASGQRPLYTQSLNVSTQNPTAALPSAGQPTTFMDTIATYPAAVDLAGRGGAENPISHAQGITGSLTGTSLGSTGQTQASPTQVLNAPLATPQWQQGLGQQLVALHQRGAQQMELHLRPADLGPLSISLKVDDQLAQLQLFSTNPQVRAAIEQAIPQLRQTLEESGIQLGEATVGEQRQQGDGNSRSADDTGLASRDDDLAAPTHEDTALMANAARPLAGNGNAVDLYA